MRRISLTLVLAAVLAAAIAATGGEASSMAVPRSPLAGKAFRLGVELLFDNGGYDNGQILYADRGVVHQLSNFDYPAWAPFPSHDNKLIEFGGAPGGVSIMNRDGTSPRLVPNTKDCYPGGWAPDDTWIALSCGFDGPGVDVPLVVVNVDGSDRRELGKMPPGESPAVNPRTGLIAFCDLDGKIYGVDPTAGSRRRLATEGGTAVNTPVWSPDGLSLLYFTTRGAGMVLHKAAPGSPPRVLRRIAWNRDVTATVSPNGQIVYGGSADIGRDLWLVDARGTHAHRLTTVGDVGDPQWLPPAR